MAKLYADYDAVISLVDFYGFRQKSTRTIHELETEIVEEIKKKGISQFDPRKLVPYIQKHELEALLFTDVDAFHAKEGVTQDEIIKLTRIRKMFPTPEDIDDGAYSTPRKRIGRIVKNYNKVADGRVIAKEISLDKMRKECTGFGKWLTTLESLANT